MLLEQLIGDLLLRHNCVVLPAFGGFVAKQSGASVDWKNGTMIPPRKSVLFNKQLINNDGLLISAFAKETAISYDEAQIHVSERIAVWQKELKKGNRVHLDKVGHLYLDAENNIGFEQDRHYNLLLQAYGLGKVHFIAEEDIQRIEISAEKEQIRKPAARPIIELIPEQVEINPTVKETPLVSNDSEKKPSKMWRYAAAAALLPFAFYSYWIPMQTPVLSSGVISISDFNPFSHTDTAVYTKKSWSFSLEKPLEAEKSLDELIAEISSDAKVYSFQFSEDLYIPIRLDRKSNAKKSETESSATVPESSAAFQLIVGCFSSQENADNLKKTLKSNGFDACVTPFVKGFRVSASQKENNSFTAEQEKLKRLKLESWVLAE